MADRLAVAVPDPVRCGGLVVDSIRCLKDGAPRYTNSPTPSVAREDLGSTFSQVIALSADKTSGRAVTLTLPTLPRGNHKVRTAFTDTTGKIRDTTAGAFTVLVK
ncbi:MAG: hypothetical protein LBK72_06865 [Bifidobacteriaceae bacterium]|jgi:hypothetical protein|nr:hypothetical protein [Bifidobacteriaceae bacterium]